MLFNQNNLILFKLFLKENNKQKEQKEAIDLIIYDYINKLNPLSRHPIKEGGQFACCLSQMIQYQFNAITNKDYKYKKKAFGIKYKDKDYEVLSQQHKTILEENKGLLLKKPYSNFIALNKDNNKDVLLNLSLCQIFLHVQLHYVYFLLFIVTKDSTLINFHKIKPLIFKSTNTIIIDESSNTHYHNNLSSMSLINSTLYFFNHNYKKYPMILQSLNESSIEILIHIIILNYYYTKRITAKFLFRHKPIQTIQTLIMLQNQNSHNPNYTHPISLLLSNFFHRSATNIKILISVIDKSNIPFDQSKIVLKKIFLTQFSLNILKIFTNILEVIIQLKNSNDILKEFLIEILMELFNEYTGDDDNCNYPLLFSLFYSSILKKFTLIVNKNKFQFEYIDNHRSKNSISLRLKEFIVLMIGKYSIVIKKLFPVILCSYHKAFSALFDVLIALNCNSEMYYNNISEHHKDTRRVLLHYFSLNFDLVSTEVLCSKMIKYYLKPDIMTYKNKINLIYEDNDKEIGIEMTVLNSMNKRIEYIASDEYKDKMLNSMSNLLKCYPFNEVNTLCTLLEIILNNEDEDREELVFLNDGNLLINKEDEEEIGKAIEGINANSTLYRNKLIEEIFKQLNNSSIEDISKLSNPVRLLIFALKHFIHSNNNNLIEACLNTLATAIKSNCNILTLSDSFKVLESINIIDNNTANSSNLYSNDFLLLVSDVKKLLISINSTKEKESHVIKETDDNQKKLEALLSGVKQITFNVENSYSMKKLIVFLSTTKPIDPNTISLHTIQNIFEIGMKHLSQSNTSFHLGLNIKLFTSLYLYIKQSKDNRTYFLKLLKEEILNALIYQKYNPITLDKLFEVLVKIIKKVKKSTCFIALDLLQIIFDVFDNHLATINQISLSSCISVLSYIIEYSHMEVISAYNTIIRSGINFLSSNTSSPEVKRASAFLLLKILKHLSTDDLEPYSNLIFQAINNQSVISKDNVLNYYLSQGLNYYS